MTVILLYPGIAAPELYLGNTDIAHTTLVNLRSPQAAVLGP